MNARADGAGAMLTSTTPGSGVTLSQWSPWTSVGGAVGAASTATRVPPAVTSSRQRTPNANLAAASSG